MTGTVQDPKCDYLWDRSGPEDQAVVELERQLGLFALRSPSVRRSPFVGAFAGVGVAAGLIAAILAGWLWWRLEWPTNRAWPILADSPRSLDVNIPLEVSESKGLTVHVARIGSLKAAPGTNLTLQETASSGHRLFMNSGSLDVRVWAPPRQFQVHTPAGQVIDMGCVFRLEVRSSGATSVRVDAGWVLLENSIAESLVPAGASAHMAPGTRPSAPVFDDAPSIFKTSVDSLERSGQEEGNGALERLLDSARVQDTITLLVLASRRAGVTRKRLLEQAALLSPPPATVSMTAIEQGDNAGLWAWHDALPLARAKSWWRRWPDVLRR